MAEGISHIAELARALDQVTAELPRIEPLGGRSCGAPLERELHLVAIHVLCGAVEAELASGAGQDRRLVQVSG